LEEQFGRGSADFLEASRRVAFFWTNVCCPVER
jgi:hypothetical protein